MSREAAWAEGEISTLPRLAAMEPKKKQLGWPISYRENEPPKLDEREELRPL
jgi:hypothetical protein